GAYSSRAPASAPGRVRPTGPGPQGSRRSRAIGPRSARATRCATPSVRRLEPVRGIGAPVHLHEVPFDVAVEPALARLVRLGVDERVVAAFRFDLERHRA